MRVVSEGGLPVSSVVWQSSGGAWALTAVCKITFQLSPGIAAVAEYQEPISEEDGYWNDDEARSLVTASDLAPFKPRADVVVTGHAFAPDRKPVRSLSVRVCAGEVDKTIEVFADRWFQPDGRIAEGSPFVQMPLRYERAAGGPESWNPVGLPFDGPRDAYGRRSIPNFQPAGAFVQWAGDSFAPIGFGPLAPSWPGRMEKLHHHMLRWSHRDWHARPLPADIDMGYFNIAPRDQQASSIRPNERILLENLHLDFPRLVTSLPGLSPRASVERASGHREEMALVADTLSIDTDRGIVSVVWRGRIGLVSAREEGIVRIDADGIDRRQGVTPWGAVTSGEGASRFDAAARRDAGPSIDVRPHLESAASPEDASVTLMGGLVTSGPALPFEASPWRVSPLASPGVGKAPGKLTGDDAATIYQTLPPGTSDTLPFAVAPAAPKDLASSRELAPSTGLAPSAGLAPSVGLALSHGLPPSPGVGTSMELERTEGAPLRPVEAPPMVAEGVAPPPMIGPLARPEMEQPPPAPLRADVPAPPESPPAAAPPPEAQLDLDEYPIERCAKITVAMACRPADASKILEEAKLNEASWSRVKSHWLEAIRKDLGKGKPGLLRRYDVAYVAQAESERGPIGVQEYARLSVAAERGTVGEMVTEMGLPSGAPIRIERVWMERLARDAALAEKVRDAVETERAA